VFQPAHQLPGVFSRLHRWIAGLSAALVLILSAAAVAPSLHELLHDGHSEHPTTDQCAVVLFAGGLVLATALVVAAPKAVWLEDHTSTCDSIFLVSPRYLHQPGRAPPSV
jgi:hypothetical protein